MAVHLHECQRSIRNEIVIGLVCQLWTSLVPIHSLARWAVKKSTESSICRVLRRKHSAGYKREVSTLQMTLFCFVL